GVTMNLILAIVFTIILKILATTTPVYTGGMTASLAKIIIYIIQINLVLMIFNLLPIPPLDGFNLITEIFNLKKYSWWYDIYDKGFIILMVLILFNFTDRILTPCVGFCMDIVSLILML
ncbi:MAG: site-2 protease family protein, partial [Anaerovoracaceae bacterium]